MTSGARGPDLAPPIADAGALTRPGARLRDELNFLLTNRIPRRLATRLCGWFSRLRTGRCTALTIAVWRLFSRDLDFRDSARRRFDSLHECFIRELKPGCRPIDRSAHVLTSPCDGIVGAHGRVEGTRVFQAKGFPYSLVDLFGDVALAERYRDGCFVTLRLKASFYHRFHAPADATLRRVVYTSGDTWNVNPIALRRVRELFVKNERASLEFDIGQPGESLAIVAVAAILVASIRLHCLGPDVDLRTAGPKSFDLTARYRKGDELGWFQHGSTLLVFGTRGLQLHPRLTEGLTVRYGEPLLCAAPAANASTEIP